MYEEESYLCCCEYYGINKKREHILSCFCNCPELDEICERVVTCRRIPSSIIKSIMNSCLDKFRFPWPGGAKPLSLEFFVPFVILPSLLLLAIVNVWLTMLSFTCICVFVHVLQTKFCTRLIMFQRFAIVSVLFIYLVFELLVNPFLEILICENVAVNVFLFIALACVWFIKVRTNNLSLRYEDDNGLMNIRSEECTICQASIPGKKVHSLWLNSCVGQHNQIFYHIFLLSSIWGFIYISNLILTTICHPFELFKFILMPDDCSEVYYDYEMTICFITAVYSILISIYLSYLLISSLCKSDHHLKRTRLEHYLLILS